MTPGGAANPDTASGGNISKENQPLSERKKDGSPECVGGASRPGHCSALRAVRGLNEQGGQRRPPEHTVRRSSAVTSGAGNVAEWTSTVETNRGVDVRSAHGREQQNKIGVSRWSTRVCKIARTREKELRRKKRQERAFASRSSSPPLTLSNRAIQGST